MVLSASWTLETGCTAIAGTIIRVVFPFPYGNRFKLQGACGTLQGNVSRRLNLVAKLTLSSAKTWGCLIGELFDYVNAFAIP